MSRALVLVGKLVWKEEGQDLLEYGLLAVLIAVAAITAIDSVGGIINDVLWETIALNI